MNKYRLKLSKPEKKNAKDIYELVKSTKVLDINSEYLYLLQSSHFQDTCSVALFENKVLGFVSGYKIPNKPNTLFIWQVAVDERIRGQDLARKLMMNILKRKENIDLEYINTTVSPSNKASIRAFEKISKKLKTEMVSKTFFEKDDFINQHEEEVLYEIGPFKLKEKNENI